MSRARLAVALLAGAFAVGACLPATIRPSDASLPLGETPAPPADLCGHLAQVYAERDALADVFRLVIENKLAQAIPAASAIRERLDTLLADLPPERGLANRSRVFAASSRHPPRSCRARRNWSMTLGGRHPTGS